MVVKGYGFGVLGNIVVGIIGAVLGGFIFSLLGITTNTLLGSLICAICWGRGAITTNWPYQTQRGVASKPRTRRH